MRFPAIVLLIFTVLGIYGYLSLQRIPVDAIPDLSDVQVIVKTSYPGQSPQLVEEQITYPLSTGLLAVPKAKTVRGFSFFGDSYIYIIFEDGTDIYWARTRVLEYLNQISSQLPASAQPELGPDASGVGWIYQYALTDTTGNQHLGDLTTLQDWFLKLELQSVPGVSEVATVGGMKKTYQIVLDPQRLTQYNLSIQQVMDAVSANNGEVGGGIIEMAEAEYMIRSQGYLTSIEQIEQIPLGIMSAQASPLLLKDVAVVTNGPELRRGIAELNGEGEVVGGIVVMRQGENAMTVINSVKAKLEQLAKGLPEGVEIRTVYDRSTLIQSSVDNLQNKLLQEIIVVIVVCLLFLWHLRSTLVAMISLPLAVLLGFVVMWLLDVRINIMSLGGIAIAVGALVDAAIVMIENLHKHLHHYQQTQGKVAKGKAHWEIVKKSCFEVCPALFISLLIITLSFIPVFGLTSQEGKLFGPLAMTKTLVMAASALLAITLVPVLLSLLVRGHIKDESVNPISRVLTWLYAPMLKLSLKLPWLTILFAIAIAGSAYYPWQKMGSEFMPDLQEGDLMYMPTTLPGVSPAKAGELLQQTDRLIKTQPEVASVFGKVGRANTATDPAPLTMLETTIQLKDISLWRPGITLDDIISELDQRVQVPGLTNAWVQPIRTRIDMLSTGVKTPVGLKISGTNLTQLQATAVAVEQALGDLPETQSAFAERARSGRYIEIVPNRLALAQYGLNIMQVQQLVRYAVGGDEIGISVQGDKRFGINLRFPQDYRQSPEQLRDLPMRGNNGQWLTLGQVASIEIADGPALIKSENGRLMALVFVDLKDNVDIAAYIQKAQSHLQTEVNLPIGSSVTFTGQYEYMQRAEQSMQYLVPLTLLIILVLLYLTFNSFVQAFLVMASLPIALSGSLWLVYLLGYEMSVAVAVGMIALAGVAAEFGVIMLLYINRVRQDTDLPLDKAIYQGALQRVRPKAMTVITIIAGLLPIMLGEGSGNEVMQRIAAPMLGGMVLSPIISMLVIPCALKMLGRFGEAPKSN